MKTTRFILLLLILFVIIANGISLQAAGSGWPLEGQTHVILNSFGEYQEFSGRVYMHTGIDIAGIPSEKTNGQVNIDASWVVVTVAGTILSYRDDASTATDNEIVIQGTDGMQYKYLHLARESIPTAIKQAAGRGTILQPGTRLAQLAPFSDGFHHLHYQILRPNAVYVNPLASITPYHDPLPPQILGIDFVNANDIDNQFTAPEAACTPVRNAVDIIAEVNDTQITAVPSEPLWVYNIDWEICSAETGNCMLRTRFVFDEISVNWGLSNDVAKAYYVNHRPWDSNSSYQTPPRSNFVMLTNLVSVPPDLSGRWFTNATPDGLYSLTVTAVDFAGNTSRRSELICVGNQGRIVELMIRDGEDDNGIVPYSGQSPSSSPDICINPVVNQCTDKITLGVTNEIRLTIWNIGSQSIPSGTEYQACIDLPPADATNALSCKFVTLTSPWQPGTSRVISLSWQPEDLADGTNRLDLLAWVNLVSADSVQLTLDYLHDNNQAQYFDFLIEQ